MTMFNRTSSAAAATSSQQLPQGIAPNDPRRASILQPPATMGLSQSNSAAATLSQPTMSTSAPINNGSNSRSTTPPHPPPREAIASTTTTTTICTSQRNLAQVYYEHQQHLQSRRASVISRGLPVPMGLSAAAAAADAQLATSTTTSAVRAASTNNNNNKISTTPVIGRGGGALSTGDKHRQQQSNNNEGNKLRHQQQSLSQQRPAPAAAQAQTQLSVANGRAAAAPIAKTPAKATAASPSPLPLQQHKQQQHSRTPHSLQSQTTPNSLSSHHQHKSTLTSPSSNITLSANATAPNSRQMQPQSNNNNNNNTINNVTSINRPVAEHVQPVAASDLKLASGINPALLSNLTKARPPQQPQPQPTQQPQQHTQQPQQQPSATPLAYLDAKGLKQQQQTIAGQPPAAAAAADKITNQQQQQSGGANNTRPTPVINKIKHRPKKSDLNNMMNNGNKTTTTPQPSAQAAPATPIQPQATPQKTTAMDTSVKTPSSPTKSVTQCITIDDSPPRVQSQQSTQTPTVAARQGEAPKTPTTTNNSNLSPRRKYSAEILSAVGLTPTPKQANSNANNNNNNNNSNGTSKSSNNSDKNNLINNNNNTRPQYQSQTSTTTTPSNNNHKSGSNHTQTPSEKGLRQKHDTSKPLANTTTTTTNSVKKQPTPASKQTIPKTTASATKTKTHQGWKGYKRPEEKPFYWEEYLGAMKSGDGNSTEVAPKGAFNQAPFPLENKFLPGMKLEAKDPRSCAWGLATVIWIGGPRMRLRFDGGDNTNDFFVMVDSEEIRPVGGSDKDILCAPIGYKANLARYPSFVEKVLTSPDVTIAPADYFFKPPNKPERNLFRRGMKLEAVDRKNPYLICPATITDVKKDEVSIDFIGWKSVYGYSCKFHSRDLFPINWCRDSGYPITAPDGWDDFSATKSEETTTTTTKESVPKVIPTPKVQAKAPKPIQKATPKAVVPPRSPDVIREPPPKIPEARESPPKVVTTQKSPSPAKVDSPPVQVDLVESIPEVREQTQAPSTSTDAHYQCQRTVPYQEWRKTKEIKQKEEESLVESPIAPVKTNTPGASPQTADASSQSDHETSIASNSSTIVNSNSSSSMIVDSEPVSSPKRKKMKLTPQDERKTSMSTSNTTTTAAAINGNNNDHTASSSKPQTSNASKSYKEWTVADVLDLIRKDEGLSKYSQVFEENEIDGKAFVLLSHDVMINHMGIKLGPVLKISALIERLKSSNV